MTRLPTARLHKNKLTKFWKGATVDIVAADVAIATDNLQYKLTHKQLLNKPIIKKSWLNESALFLPSCDKFVGAMQAGEISQKQFVF